MKRTRQVLVMTLVATALCADRVVTAAPSLRDTLANPSADPIARLATHLASRFTCTFRRTSGTTVRLHQPCPQDAPSAPLNAAAPVLAFAPVHAAVGSPFQFRLPPPSL